MENVNHILGRKQIVGIAAVVLILMAAAGGVYLVQRQQSLKSKASAVPFINAFEMKDASGTPVPCAMSATPGVAECTTNSLDISVRVKDTAPLLP